MPTHASAPSANGSPAPEHVVRFLSGVRQRIGTVVVGQDAVVERILIALLTSGHLLLEGVPGLAKTLLVSCLAKSIHLSFARIQFTIDLLPSDILGSEILDQRTNEFRVNKGPVFTNLLLADEINRAAPKVQSALLEAMQERKVTIGKEAFKLPSPFLVIATQNPVEQAGTFELPERNLKELSEWVSRIKKLPGGAGDLDDEMMVKAFTACHSSAEVYRTEAIEAVFGPLGGLKPKTLAGLTDQMRTNLAGLWKEPAEQKKKKTNRKKKDIEAEVLRGYQVARTVIGDGLKKFPNHWALLAAQAGIVHDEVNYRQELAKSSDFSKNRGLAFAVYRLAAEDYAKAVLTMPESEHTTNVYEQWFAASLGAVDLGMITEEKQPDWTQPPLIRAAILALPGELAEKHMAKFANNLFIKMSGAKPHVKFNYLKAGFQIVGDHKQAVEAKKVFDYYKDLVTEIKLETVIDGADRVGYGRPFGLFVNLRHTRDIERESGGFGRYLQNQNSMMYSYNYGRPTADYRDRFETAAREALKEHFEVVSVTFQDEKVNSRALPNEFGWRYTPYAYILMKPRGPQVDKIPPLRLDLDFLDTSGYVVMPVESPAVPIDARDKSGDTRPVEKLTVTQTLDERQADKGVLLLEVRATGVGLVPDLKELCSDIAPAGFEITKTDDQGLGVKKFEEDADRNGVVSERTWTLTLKGKDGQAELPKSFRFAEVKVPAKEVIYQRYSDADLVTVAAEIPLEKTYGQKSTISMWLVAACAVLAIVLLVGVLVLLTRPKRPVAVSRIPADLDAFTAAALLREISERPELSAAQRAELDQQLAEIERYYFSANRNGSPSPDLRRIVEKWVATVPGWSRIATAAATVR